MYTIQLLGIIPAKVLAVISCVLTPIARNDAVQITHFITSQFCFQSNYIAIKYNQILISLMIRRIQGKWLHKFVMQI